MGRAPCCAKVGLKKGAWSAEEDQKLVAYIQQHGHPNWRALPKLAGLLRCGKSCRLRWINYLRPDIKRGNFSEEEEEQIIRLHESLGNRWSAIAAQLPGRTDNEIKNVWHTDLKKRLADRSKAASAAAGRGKPVRKAKVKKTSATAPPAAEEAAAPAAAEKAEAGRRPDASPERSSVSSAATEPSSSSKEESSGLEVPPLDESFWWSEEMAAAGDMALSEEELSLAASSSRSEDMEFWFQLLLEAGDMADLPVL